MPVIRYRSSQTSPANAKPRITERNNKNHCYQNRPERNAITHGTFPGAGAALAKQIIVRENTRTDTMAKYTSWHDEQYNVYELVWTTQLTISTADRRIISCKHCWSAVDELTITLMLLATARPIETLNVLFGLVLS